MIVILSLFVVIALLIYKSVKRPTLFPPGPVNLPIVGYLPFLTNHPHEKFIQLGKQYGDIFGFNFGPFQRLVVLNSYDVIKDAYKEDVFTGRPDTYFFHVRSDDYHGVAFNHGPAWQELRRYTLRVLRDFGFGKSVLENAISHEALELIASFKEDVGQPLELQGRFNLCIVNTLWAITTGQRINTNDPEMNTVIANLRRIISSIDVSGLPLIIPYSKYIPPVLIGASYSMAQIKCLLDMFGREVESQQKVYSRDGQADNLIKKFIEKTVQTSDPSSAFCKEEGRRNLVNITLDLFVAGSETVSSTLTWMILLLACNPDVQNNVHRELDAVVGRDRFPSLEDKIKLPLTEAVIMETLRVASLTPLGLPHCVMEDTVFHGFRIPKGTFVMSNLYAVHRDPTVWEKPNEFYPQHFLNDQGELKYIERFIPFSIGKRVCLGESLARMELFIFAAYLLHTFRFSLPEDQPLPNLEASQTLIRLPPRFQVVLKIR